MIDSNVHKHSLFVNVVPKYLQCSVQILNGVGSVPAQEFYQPAEITFGSTTESITIDNKSFVVSDSGYSGEATVIYYAKDFCRQFIFSLYASGVSQVKTFIGKIIVKVYGSAFGSFFKNMISLIYIKEKSNNYKLECLKNAIATFTFSFNLRGIIKNLKNILSSITINFEMTKIMSILRIMFVNFGFQVYGSADITVAKYRILSEFSANTLNDLVIYTLEDMIYTEN
jgi:hypothetical protein